MNRSGPAPAGTRGLRSGPSPQVLTPELVMFVLESAAAAGAVAAAARLGILDRLDRGPVDAAVLARDCAVSERGAELLLPALAGLRLVERDDDGRYRPAAPLASVWALVEPWEHLEAAVLDGRPLAEGDNPAGAESLYADLVPLLAQLFAPAAERAADLIAFTGPSVLDVGAGAAPWSLALAARDHARRITAVDLPDVLAATRRAVRAAGLEAQFEFLSGDMFAVDWPRTGDYDLALAANVCHLFDEQTNLRLVARLVGALRSGGTLAIVDLLPHERLDGPRSTVLYALGLLLRTGSGRAYPLSAYTRWFEEAGLEAVQRHELGGSPPFALITARRP